MLSVTPPLRQERISFSFSFFVVRLDNNSILVAPKLLPIRESSITLVVPFYFPKYLPVLTCDACFDTYTVRVWLSASGQGITWAALHQDRHTEEHGVLSLPFASLPTTSYCLLSMSVSHRCACTWCPQYSSQRHHSHSKPRTASGNNSKLSSHPIS